VFDLWAANLGLDRKWQFRDQVRKKTAATFAGCTTRQGPEENLIDEGRGGGAETALVADGFVESSVLQIFFTNKNANH
jgi:hypothetical protein